MKFLTKFFRSSSPAKSSSSVRDPSLPTNSGITLSRRRISSPGEAPTSSNLIRVEEAGSRSIGKPSNFTDPPTDSSHTWNSGATLSRRSSRTTAYDNSSAIENGRLDYPSSAMPSMSRQASLNQKASLSRQGSFSRQSSFGRQSKIAQESRVDQNSQDGGPRSGPPTRANLPVKLDRSCDDVVLLPEIKTSTVFTDSQQDDSSGLPLTPTRKRFSMALSIRGDEAEVQKQRADASLPTPTRNGKRPSFSGNNLPTPTGNGKRPSFTGSNLPTPTGNGKRPSFTGSNN